MWRFQNRKRRPNIFYQSDHVFGNLLYIKASSDKKQQTPPQNEMGFIVSTEVDDVAEKGRLELPRRFPDLRP